VAAWPAPPWLRRSERDGFDDPITVIGEENQRPYERLALSKDYRQNKTSIADVYVHPADWYADHQVQTRLGQPAGRGASTAGIEVDNGIVADEHLRSSDPTILAVGDVANARQPVLERRIRVEHWDNAIRQGRLAAATVLDRPGRYNWRTLGLAPRHCGVADS
jgi:NAD(P)H-nitrite reductase large subunit